MISKEQCLKSVEQVEQACIDVMKAADEALAARKKESDLQKQLIKDQQMKIEVLEHSFPTPWQAFVLGAIAGAMLQSQYSH